MKAWVLKNHGKLVLREIPQPSPGPDEVLVKIAYVGLCGSDIEIFRGHREWEVPVDPPVLGHEASGVVVAAGNQVMAFAEGDRVVLRGVWGCCSEYVKATVISPPNSRVARFLQILRIPDWLPMQGSSLLEVLPKILLAADRASITSATDVLVIGQGVTGLLMTQAVNLKRPHRLVAVDLFEEKLALSRAFGATHTVVRRGPDLATDLKDILPDGADVVIPCHLEGEGVPEAIELLKWRGKLVLWGCLGKAPMDFFRIHAHGADILATQFDNLAEDEAYCAHAINCLERGLIRIQSLTTHVFDFDRMPDAFALKSEFRREVIHVLVKMPDAMR